MTMDGFPAYRGDLRYHCLECKSIYPGNELHYTCPQCRGVFLLQDHNFSELKKTSGAKWRDVFDRRAAGKMTQMRGIFRFYELIAPVVDQEDVVYLGEGNTPVIESSPKLQRLVGRKTAFKNDGQNPSASFKDRGMACAFSYLKQLVKRNNWEQVLTICASTGDTSASAALYAAYVDGPVKSVVLLPQGKVTSQQLSQPLGSGAAVIELPGVFDDCMRVVEYLADNYRVALLNSKNPWRILGQESYAFELAQWSNWDMAGRCVFVPIGNAGNITAVMNGFLKLKKLKIIQDLPRIFGVQSIHADPVYRYYRQAPRQRNYAPVEVSPSVAQAAMIGNPVSFPRVRELAARYQEEQGEDAFNVVHVQEQQIIESMLLANQNGHIACTQGGECLAGLLQAKDQGLVAADEYCILDATAHALKFSGFQEMYFSGSFPPGYEIIPRQEYINQPQSVLSEEDRNRLGREEFTRAAVDEMVRILGLQGN
ncbi:threonine synthase [Desulfonatronospira sp.]|uniref:threonine synthase n=1 Tax=Desulfonatronospira sp. TaxID=1962951 RepID=UPI0025BE8B7D|nr:threonine synthase [Desulfonatronospira sp.]